MQTIAHPLNTHFDWRSPQAPFGLVSEQQAQHFDQHGYVVLNDVFDKDTLDQVRKILDEYEAQMDEVLQASKTKKFVISFADKFTVSTHIAAQNKYMKSFANGTLFKDLCHDLMGCDVQLYHDQLVYKKRDLKQVFPWHQDNGYLYLEPQQYVTCWMPLVDATEENGCPWVIPGAHKQGTLNHKRGDYGFVCIDEEKPAEAVCCPVKAGDLLVFSSLCPHMTGPNVTDDVRKAYIVQYCNKSAKRIAYNRDTGKRYFGARIRAGFDYFMMGLILKSWMAKAFMKHFG